jgi:hypothetical protein
MKKKFIVEYYGGCSHFDNWEDAAAFIKKECKAAPVTVSYA